jgi:hypothetical protein
MSVIEIPPELLREPVTARQLKEFVRKACADPRSEEKTPAGVHRMPAAEVDKGGDSGGGGGGYAQMPQASVSHRSGGQQASSFGNDESRRCREIRQAFVLTIPNTGQKLSKAIVLSECKAAGVSDLVLQAVGRRKALPPGELSATDTP